MVIIINAWALAPELDVARVDLNDSVFHFTIIDRLAHDPALEPWMPEWSFGYPVLRIYQPLAHWIVVAIHFATFQAFPLDALFAFVRWLLLALFPLSAYLGCRWIPMRPMTAAAVALLAPLIASQNLYGIEYGSYIWRGNGLYTQLVAMHLFVLVIGAGCRAIRGGRAVWAAGLLLALTFLAHFIYGYMAGATLVLIAALPDQTTTLPRRLARLGWIAALSIVVTAFQLLPMITDGAFINRSRWEPAWKWTSFGAARVFGLAATGDLLDAGRLPVLSLLALAGTIAIVRRRSDERFAGVFAVSGALLWLFLFAGPAAWGPLFKTLGLSEAAQIHRFIGAAQWFLVVLAGIGLAQLWSSRRSAIVIVTVTALLLWPAVAERRNFLREDAEWGGVNLTAYEANRDALDRTIDKVRAMGGRVYPGLAAGWGGQLRIGYVPLYAFLSEAHVPAVAFLYHSMALPADVMVRFDENRLDHYRLFDVRTVVADAARPLPSFLRAVETIGPFRILEAPATGAFALVHATHSVYVDRRTFYDVNDAWLQSRWPDADAHLVLDYESRRAALRRPRLESLAALAQTPASSPCGSVPRQSTQRAEVEVTGDCVGLFKTTYHPNWRATVDGRPTATVMLSPGFVGVPLTRGRHVVALRYEPGIARPLLLGLALPLFLLVLFAERKGVLQRLEARCEAVHVRIPPYALLTAVLILPALAPFLGASQPSGHDVLQYLPRLTEFHENIRHGILFPRWAPDLGSGQGQPLFLLNPPLFYAVSEIFHLIGLPFTAAMNATCALMIAAAAAAMFLLASWYFGPRGGALAAVAYVYAPYFLVDLYVRTAFAELCALPLYPLAIYGFGRHAASRQRRFLAIGALAYAAMWFAHTPAALLFTPLLGAFLVYLAWSERNVRLFVTQTGAAALGMLLAATVWLPSLEEARYAHTERLTEGVLRYSNHFVAPAQFFANTWGFGPSVPGDQDGMPFTLGWPQLIIAAIGAIAIARSDSTRWKRWAAFFGVSAFVLCFLMTERAHELWDAVPQLHYVAFPWRLLASVAFCLALLASAIVLALPRVPERWQRWTYAAVLASIVLVGLPRAQPQSYLSLDPLQWTPREIARRGAVAATFESFEPKWVVERPVWNGGAIRVARGSATTSVYDRDPTTMAATVRATTDCDLELPIAYFPGWQVRVDGAEMPHETPTPTGRIRVMVNAGTHRVEARFERTPIRWAADATSALAALVFAAFALAARRAARVSA
ncbi:MAG TPA: hypothetical protein VJ276_07255 [Thermoanaerobaculia bacterium]|nr:hypothetical protein [Thermoanaerobaculia bacterium]